MCILISDNKLIKNEDTKPYLQEFTEKKKIKQEKYSEEDAKLKFVNILSNKNMKNIKRKSEYPCPDCGKAFKILRTLQSHKSNDCGKIYTCPKCGKKYPYRASFCRHKNKCSRPKTM